MLSTELTAHVCWHIHACLPPLLLQAEKQAAACPNACQPPARVAEAGARPAAHLLILQQGGKQGRQASSQQSPSAAARNHFGTARALGHCSSTHTCSNQICTRAPTPLHTCPHSPHKESSSRGKAVPDT